MMSRGEVAIAIAKINKTTMLLRYWLGLGQETYSSALDSELSQLAKWVSGVEEFLRARPQQKVYEMLSMVATDNDVRKFLMLYSDAMPKEVQDSLLAYLPIKEKLSNDGKAVHRMSKTEYSDLADGLDNPEVVALLKRAQDVNILDAHFKPMPDIHGKQLKVLAFAIMQKLGIKSRVRWVPFDAQWTLEGKQTLCHLRLPSPESKKMRLITDLFPDVDFTPLFTKETEDYFIQKLTDEEVIFLYYGLHDEGYISRDTTLENFQGIFKPVEEGERVPVRWMATQRELSFFVYHALRYKNELTLWQKACNCFSLDGERPNKDTMSNFLTKIKKQCELYTYDPVLYQIVTNLS